ncbi:hypothetical protein PITCH_A1380008 [uncultured Desulfobacterium sp.]|uniref:Uncharacterized protein n=1 Tax=uncultured Desulfobacterium sp. TaxID=201089 RepID=A0A445MSK9_9BACT|nr:hypothetical protein PITCH_A1380008 [uncultured Desulfobacterium sp.]
MFGSVALLADGLHMGSHASAIVTRSSRVLLCFSAHILLDMRTPAALAAFYGEVRKTLECVYDGRISDLHVWAIEPEIYAAEAAFVSSSPHGIDDYYNLLPSKIGIVHITVEICHCPSSGCKTH